MESIHVYYMVDLFVLLIWVEFRVRQSMVRAILCFRPNEYQWTCVSMAIAFSESHRRQKL